VIPGELARSLHALTAQLDAAADDLVRQEFGLSHSQLGFLMPLLEHAELDITSLAAALNVSVPAVSKRVVWFTERDLVRSRSHPEGGRRVALALTPSGRRLAVRASTRLRSRLDELVADWPEGRLQQLHTLVTELSTTVSTASPANDARRRTA
jgi:DNA-binding MarR family transcriptional regulator